MIGELNIARFPYEEPHHTCLEISASNGETAGFLKIYIGIENLIEAGKTLEQFPRKIGDEYIFSIGSEDPQNRYAYFFCLKAYMITSSGQCALQISINNLREMPLEGSAKFSIEADPSAINKLGKLLIKMADYENSEITWTSHESKFYESRALA